MTCFALGLLSKEIAVVLPALLLIYEGLLRQKDVIARPRAAAARYLPFVAAGLIYLGVRRLLLGQATVSVVLSGVDPMSGGGRGLLPNLFTQAKVLFLYLRLIVAPFGQSIDHDVAISSSPFEPASAAALVGIAVIAAFAWKARRRMPLVSFGLAWFGIALLPTSLIPLNVVANEHRLYLPSIGLVIAVCGFVAYAWPSWELLPALARRSALGLAIVGLSAATLARNEVWKTELGLWTDTVAKDPGSHRAHLNLGNLLATRGDIEAAAEHYREALAIWPSYRPAHINLGEALLRLGAKREDLSMLEESEHHLRIVLHERPDIVLARLKLAQVYGARNQITADPAELDEEHRQLEEALSYDPTYWGTHQALAEYYEHKGDPDEAARHYRKIALLQPSATWALLRSADCWVQAGSSNEAIRDLNQLLIADPFNADAHKRLAAIYRSASKPDLATRHERMANQLLGSPGR